MKHIIVVVMAFAFLLAAAPVSAQGLRVNVGGNTSVSPTSTRAQAEFKGEVEGRRASSTEARAEMQLSIVKRAVTNVSRVLTATVTRLEGIAERVDSRIGKFKASGAVTTESEGFLAEARVHLKKAEASIEALTSVELAGETLRENFVIARSAAAEAKMHIREAHTALMKTVRSLKASGGVKVEGGANATTTN